jgi:3-hydroxyisobutyrate dehydrogenase-like beta-hydroxyacid dehydrogenase
MQVVGIVSAGAMGSSLGARLRQGGARVVVALEGRSGRTRRLAAEAGLEDVSALGSLLRQADVVLSVVPPEAAVRVVAAIAEAAAGARPVVADLNAVSPGTAREIASLLGAAGIDAVDGAISGPPPVDPGTTRIYLSGPRAETVAALPLDGVERVVVGDEPGLASAVKMCTASVYKGHTALLAQALVTARANGVLVEVLDDLHDSFPRQLDRAARLLAVSTTKAGRYVGEMREIAATQANAGLTPALFEAMAEVYARLAETELAARAPESIPAEPQLEDVLEQLGADAGERT